MKKHRIVFGIMKFSQIVPYLYLLVIKFSWKTEQLLIWEGFMPSFMLTIFFNKSLIWCWTVGRICKWKQGFFCTCFPVDLVKAEFRAFVKSQKFEQLQTEFKILLEDISQDALQAMHLLVSSCWTTSPNGLLTNDLFYYSIIKYMKSYLDLSLSLFVY